jgi:hypothetical protein
VLTGIMTSTGLQPQLWHAFTHPAVASCTTLSDANLAVALLFVRLQTSVLRATRWSVSLVGCLTL